MKNVNEISFECWWDENEEWLIESYYESGACYDSSLEWYADYMYEKSIEERRL